MLDALALVAIGGITLGLLGAVDGLIQRWFARRQPPVPLTDLRRQQLNAITLPRSFTEPAAKGFDQRSVYDIHRNDPRR